MALFGRKRDTAQPAGQGSEVLAKQKFAEGKREFDAGRFDQAVTVFREVVALTPDSPNSQFLLGASLFKTGDPGAAVGPLRQCVAMRPEHAEAHLILGMSLGRLDEFDEAEPHMAKSASLGDRQAQGLLPRIGIDYCRRCAGPARLWNDDSDADIVMVDAKDGMTCTKCRTVLCGSCAGGGRSGPMRLVCPDCGGSLRVLAG